MKIGVLQGSLAEVEAEVVVVNLFEGVQYPGGGTGAVDAAMDGAITRLAMSGDLTGQAGEIKLIYTMGMLPSPRLIVAGMGRRMPFTARDVRDLSADVARYVREMGCRTMATIVHGAGIAGLNPVECAVAVAEGSLIGGLRATRQPGYTGEDLQHVALVEHDPAKAVVMAVAIGTAFDPVRAFMERYDREPERIRKEQVPGMLDETRISVGADLPADRGRQLRSRGGISWR